MNSISKLENTVGGWLKTAPHLSKTSQKWLAENVWWIVLIGLVLSVLGLVATVFALMAIFFPAVSYFGVLIAPALSFAIIANTTVPLIFFVATVILTAMAISPLKQLKRRGWDLMFITMVISGLYSILSFIVSFSIGSLLGGAIGLAIGLYFLYEIRSYFDETVTVKEKKAK